MPYGCMDRINFDYIWCYDSQKQHFVLYVICRYEDTHDNCVLHILHLDNCT